MLDFYKHHGLLIDFDMTQGYEDYDILKKKIWGIIKH